MLDDLWWTKSAADMITSGDCIEDRAEWNDPLPRLVTGRCTRKEGACKRANELQATRDVLRDRAWRAEKMADLVFGTV